MTKPGVLEVRPHHDYGASYDVVVINTKGKRVTYRVFFPYTRHDPPVPKEAQLHFIRLRRPVYNPIHASQLDRPSPVLKLALAAAIEARKAFDLAEIEAEAALLKKEAS